jgi:hypothetical protein
MPTSDDLYRRLRERSKPMVRTVTSILEDLVRGADTRFEEQFGGEEEDDEQQEEPEEPEPAPARHP